MSDDANGKTRFVYVTYIKSTRERVFRALTDSLETTEYWFGHRIESDWTVGGPLRFYHGGQMVHDDTLLAYEPPTTLSYSWKPLRKGFEADGTSRVTFTLEEVQGQVKLTLVHDELIPGGKMLDAISGGWPAVLSNLKTRLETGAAFEMRPPCG